MIGTDAGDMFAPSFAVSWRDGCSPAALDAAIFDNYVEGWHDAGWQGNWNAVRFAYTAHAALKYGCLLLELRDIFDKDRYEVWQNVSGLSMAAYLHQKAVLIYYLLDLADEARELMQSL